MLRVWSRSFGDAALVWPWGGMSCSQCSSEHCSAVQGSSVCAQCSQYSEVSIQYVHSDCIVNSAVLFNIQCSAFQCVLVPKYPRYQTLPSSWSVMNRHKLSYIVMNCQYLPWIIMYRHELSWIAMSFHESLWNIKNSHESS